MLSWSLGEYRLAIDVGGSGGEVPYGIASNCHSQPASQPGINLLNIYRADIWASPNILINAYPIWREFGATKGWKHYWAAESMHTE